MGGLGKRSGRAAGLAAIAAVLLAVPAAQAAPVIHEFPATTPVSHPIGIALGPDGNMWFTEDAVDMIGKITPSGTVTEYGGETDGGSPEYITAGPGGKLWFTETGAIASMTTSGTVQEFPLPTGYTEPAGLAEGSDGNLWFGATGPSLTPSVVQMTPAGTFTEFTVGNFVADLTAGPDGNLWFTLGNRIGRITTAGKVKTFGGLTGICCPTAITAGPNGNLWFAEDNASQIGEMTTGGALLGEFKLTPGSLPNGIAPEADGTVWFVENEASRIGQMSSGGTLLGEWPTPTSNSFPPGIAAGGSNVWFTEEVANQIGEALLPHVNIRYISYIPNFFILKVAPLTGQGQQVSWLMESPGTHGIADSSGMGLFGFGPAGGPAPVAMGSVFSYVFQWAGSYAYDDPFQPAVTGMVRVPTLVSLLPGTTSTAQVVWAANDAPSGFVFDVQLRQPGGSRWLHWRTGVTELQSALGPGDPLYAGSGTYQFRARLRDTANGTHSGYSKPASIAVT